MSKAEPLTFDISLGEIPVILGKDGAQKRYVLREMDGRARGRYLDTIKDYLILDEKGKCRGLKKLSGHQTTLLSFCLFEVDGESPVPIEEIEMLPSRVITDLFDAANQQNGLDKEAGDVAKND